ncbi:hypothetical protein SAMN04489842_0986 [Natronobacterium texcoconense]|uniref:Uncharacterized protein n=1 Tax=Natronobacterium texcoconense TaxID=1095778 RepID=A0A1H1BB32_NATTX|nr:hypothetical protein SAMN04489842_0986 [Natronobacterium texcoconense]
MIQATHSSDRLPLAVSFACFVVAGGTTATTDATVPTLGATAVAIGAVYALALYAKAVTRRTLAQLSIAFWIAFIAVAGLHAVGLGTVGATVPGPAETIAFSLSAITWGTFLTACGSTAFLAAREYGASAGSHVEADEQVLEGETSDYSTR